MTLPSVETCLAFQGMPKIIPGVKAYCLGHSVLLTHFLFIYFSTRFVMPCMPDYIFSMKNNLISYFCLISHMFS